MTRRTITHHRREIILALLRPGKWVHSRALWEAACPELGGRGFNHLVSRMRNDGYVLESEGGLEGRGWRLISEPDAMRIAA